MDRRRRPLVAMGLGLGLALALVAAAELGLRLTGLAPPPGGFYFARLGEALLEPDMYTGHPRRFFTLRAGYRHSRDHAGPNALDRWAFRGEPAEPLPPGLPRVVVLGDSCAYGLPLPANEALPARLDAHLGAAGHPALVVGQGVPGYTTVQIGALLEEVLAAGPVAALVLYPAAWNDQAPALGKNDLELRDEAGEPGLLARSALMRLLQRAGSPQAEPSDGRTRVPEEAVEGEVRAMIRAAREAGATVVVIAPPHPPENRTTHARMFRDADAVRRAARAEEALLVDLQPGLDAGQAGAEFFADLVHPAADGADRLGAAVAEVLGPELAPAGPTPAGPVRLVALDPASVPALGDVELTLTLDGWSAGDPLPAVTVGGTALLDPAPAGGNRLRGVVPRLGGGPCRVRLRTAEGLSEAPLEVLLPWVEAVGGSDRIRVHSRPGDSARVFASSALAPAAEHSANGAFRLDTGAMLGVELQVRMGEHGSGEAQLPPLPGDVTVFVQALVLPPGEELGSHFGLWSEVAELP